MAHNGGRLQVNPWNIGYWNDFAFMNLLKAAQAWGYVGGGVAPASDFDTNGYPTAILNGGYTTTFGIPNQADRPGQYVIKWTGDGTITLSGATVASGSLSGADGRAVLNITAADSASAGRATIDLNITGVGASDYIRHIAFVHIDDEAAYDGGAVFGVRFKERLIEGGFGVIRFLDWMAGSGSFGTTAASQLPVGHYTYTSAGHYDATRYAGTTTKTGTAYTIAAPPGWTGLADKAVILGEFDADGLEDGTITLDVGGTGAKPLHSWAFVAPAVESYTTPLAGKYFSAIYDALLDKWLFGGGNTFNATGIGAPVHISLMVQLCNEVGAHPWFTIPPMALDPLTDYVTTIATYCRDNLDAGLVPRFEPANEVWNESFGFVATRLAYAKNVARGGASETHEWYGRVLSEVGQAVSAVYGDDRTKYQVICGVQSVYSYATATHDARLTSADLVAETGVAGDAAKFWTTHVACAGYWNPMLQDPANDAAETSAADEYATATTARKAEIADAYVVDNTLNQSSWLGEPLFTKYTNWKTWGDGHGVTGLTQYEGGYSPDYGDGTNIDALRAGSKNSPELIYQTQRNYQAFLGAGGEFPSVYLFAGQGAAWPVLDPSIYVSPDPPQWEAIKNYKAGKLRFKTT